MLGGRGRKEVRRKTKGLLTILLASSSMATTTVMKRKAVHPPAPKAWVGTPSES